MDIDFSLQLPKILSGFSLLMLFPVILVIANWFNERVSPYNIKDELMDRNNIALGVSFMAYNLAVTSVFIGAMLGPSVGLWEDLLIVGGYSLLGVALLYLARVINNRLILYKFSNVKELIDDRNFGTGVVQAGSYLASGFIVAASLHGEGGGVVTAIAFFLLAQLMLVAYAFIYNWITSFDIHHEIEQDNASAGLAVSGNLIALGIILMNAVGGNFISWEHNLMLFFRNTALAFILLPVFRLLLDRVVFSHTDLSEKIVKDKNIPAGMLEFAVTISFSIVLYFMI
ncbi:hypothetical protein MNBD_GAMMA11-933 [hydrothermal vent metagenome]|uniref:DUF350 domain-containing protein n=1 Tax=hydrothermal vent metagenome TaxID=652676 RepID=A0A3B0Y0Q1_9ZZZZ